MGGRGDAPDDLGHGSPEEDDGEGREGRSLLVRNLRYETSPRRVRAAFETYGQIRDVYLPLDHDTRKPRGFGFVEFYDERDAATAQREMDRAKLDGNEVSVIVAQNRRKSPDTMRRMMTGQPRVRGGRGHPDERRRSRSPYHSRSAEGASRSRSYEGRYRSAGPSRRSSRRHERQDTRDRYDHRYEERGEGRYSGGYRHDSRENGVEGERHMRRYSHGDH
eukprot:Lankesteria_metandrocarpae@DN1925_c0_g1_i1.p1